MAANKDESAISHGSTGPRGPSTTSDPQELTALTARGPPGTIPIVAIGASAGGLEAASRLIDGLPATSGLTFILVQHLDPTHKSLMVDLLAEHTTMKVVEATDRCLLKPDQIHVIPPGRYLSVRSGAIHLSPPQALHGARLPFDFLLSSLAESCGDRTVCVVLSGTGADGSRGIAALKSRGRIRHRPEARGGRI